MNCAETIEQDTIPAASKSVVQMPLGLLGFEHIKQYVVLANPEEAPFLWLQILDDRSLAFLAAPASEIISDYRPQLSQEDVKFLGLSKPDDALVLNIVTLKESGQATANLKGPIVINRHTLIGKQVVPLNAADYSLQYPLTAAE